MNPRPYVFDVLNNSTASRFSSSLNNLDRPQTPVALIQQSSPDQYKKSLVDSVAGYMDNSQRTNNRNKPSSDLLPKDVNYYYVETERITAKVDEVFRREKEQIERLLDEYLKKIIATFEEKKVALFAVLDADQGNFHNFYQRFIQSVDTFLKDSMNKLTRIMEEEERLQQHARVEERMPVHQHLIKLQTEARSAQIRINAMQEISADYERTAIEDSKKVIEHMLVDPSAEEAGQGAVRKRTSINRNVLVQSLEACVKHLDTEIQNLRFRDSDPRPPSKTEIPHFIPQAGPVRGMSPALWEKLHPDRTQLITADLTTNAAKKTGISNFGNLSALSNSKILTRPSSCEPTSSSIMNLNLENQLKTEKRVHFGMPTIAEEKKSEFLKTQGSTQQPQTVGDLNMMKQSNINISIHNVPVNNGSYINIYNGQNAAQKEHTSVYQRMGVVPPKLQSPLDTIQERKGFRPLSGNAKPLTNFYQNKQTRELDLTSAVAPAVVSVLKTNILSKSSNMAKKFRTKLLLNDYSSSINCFDIDAKNSLVVLGTSKGALLINKVDLRTMTFLEERVVELAYTPSADPKKPSGVILLAQLRPGLILAATSGSEHVLYSVDTVSGTIVTRFKTFRESVKLIAFYDATNFLMLGGSERIILYNCGQPDPKKSFKIPITDLVDICMSSPKTIFVISSTGEIRVIKLGGNADELTIDGQMKVEGKICSLDVFYNNEKMLLVHTQVRDEDLISIINTQTKKIMKVIRNRRQPPDVYAFATVTLRRNTADVFLVCVGENEMKYWDIDGQAASQDIESENGESFHLKGDVTCNGKPVKMMGFNNAGQIVAIGLCTMGVMSFTLV